MTAGAGNAVLELKHHVISGRLPQAVRFLQSSHMSLEDCVDDDGNTALHWCAQGVQEPRESTEATDEEMLVFLLESGAPRNRQNSLGETPLLTLLRAAPACAEGRAERLAAMLLRRAQADATRPDMSGETPLMEACGAGLEPLARLLLEHHADPLASSSSGLTAAQLAADSGATGCVELLRSPLAARAAQEARARAASGEEEDGERRQQRQAKLLGATLFGQKMQPGLAKDADRPGKPYPELGTLHDID
eukprot:TRINITY_DN49335_c0_g1_i1.p1 TRINITY_DN49335_c0_g1~~TRINITY_DN49335_c0_g1_i1.p1  ORF type:complete len:249 (-),score=52.20 TRINITY_DN49335_c0_g1_i1:11-757(-)